MFNADETAFFLSPKGQRVLTRKGESTVYNNINNDEKENLTTLMNANAAGMIVPPMIVFKYERIPAHVTSLIPDNWGVARSENGWMTGATFYEYIANIFYPWILKNKIQLPVAFFVDGHSSHLTYSLSQFCIEHKIILMALYPNSTHIIQPMDVAVFRPLKNGWKTAVQKWRIENNGARFKKEHFANVLNEAIGQSITPEIIGNGFKSTGLFPLNPDAINFNKYFKEANSQIRNSVRNENQQGIKKYLQFVEDIICKELLEEFKKSSGSTWSGSVEHTSLFQFWMKVKSIDIADKNPEVELRVPTRENEEDIIEKLAENEEAIIEKPAENEKVVVDKLAEDEEAIVEKPAENEEAFIDTPAESTVAILSEKSPENLITLPFQVPSPFKKCLFWPDTPKNTNLKRRKEKIPSVAVSKQWQDYHLKKKQIKIQKEEEKLERKRKREEKAQLQKPAKKNKIPVNNDETSDSSVEMNLESEEEGDEWMQIEKNNENEKSNNYGINDHVIIKYEGEYFPGVITKLDINQIMVSVMCISGINRWKWPTLKDEMNYLKEDIVCKIAKPVPINTRGIFQVPEIEKFNKFWCK